MPLDLRLAAFVIPSALCSMRLPDWSRKDAKVAKGDILINFEFKKISRVLCALGALARDRSCASLPLDGSHSFAVSRRQCNSEYKGGPDRSFFLRHDDKM